VITTFNLNLLNQKSTLELMDCDIFKLQK